MRGQGGAYRGGVFFFFRGGKLNNKKITKIKNDQGLTWPPFDFFHATTNQKFAGMTEGGWDRTRDHARMLGECIFIVLGLFGAQKQDQSKNRERGGT